MNMSCLSANNRSTLETHSALELCLSAKGLAAYLKGARFERCFKMFRFTCREAGEAHEGRRQKHRWVWMDVPTICCVCLSPCRSGQIGEPWSRGPNLRLQKAPRSSPSGGPHGWSLTKRPVYMVLYKSSVRSVFAPSSMARSPVRSVLAPFVAIPFAPFVATRTHV